MNRKQLMLGTALLFLEVRGGNMIPEDRPRDDPFEELFYTAFDIINGLDVNGELDLDIDIDPDVDFIMGIGVVMDVGPDFDLEMKRLLLSTEDIE